MKQWVASLVGAALCLNIAEARKVVAPAPKSFLLLWRDLDRRVRGTDFGPYRIAAAPSGAQCTYKKEIASSETADVLHCSSSATLSDSRSIYYSYSAMLGSLGEGAFEAYRRMSFDRETWSLARDEVAKNYDQKNLYQCRQKFLHNASQIPMSVDICYRRTNQDLDLSDALISARIFGKGYRPLSAHLALGGVNKNALPRYLEFFVDSIRPGGGL